MNLLIFFSVVFATIIFAIVLERIIHCPILVGFAFFSFFLVVATIFNNTILVIIAIALGILAFIVAFWDCILRNSRFFRNNKCLRCNCDDEENERENENNNCGCNQNNSVIRIVSGSGRTLNTSDTSSQNCGCEGRNNRCRRY